MRVGRVLVALVVVSLVSAACSSGSKSARGARRSGSIAAGPLASDGGSTVPGAAASPAAARASSAGRTATGGTTKPGAGVPSGGAAGASSASTKLAPSAGRGFTASEIRLGFYVDDPGSQNQIYAALGVPLQSPDAKGAAEALAAYFNARGGLAGRKVVPIVRLETSNGSWSGGQQSACSTFTEDNQVFAATATVTTPETEVLASCLAQHQTLYMFNNRLVFDHKTFEQWAPYVYGPSYLSGERWGALLDGLASTGYFDKGARVGIIWQDVAATGRTVSSVIKPRLAALGAPVAAESSYAPPNSTAELSGAAAQIQSAVLRFRQAGVSHVMFVGTSGEGPLFFATEAESQGYRPRYAFNSTEIPQFQTTTVPAAQLARAVSVGWEPMLDVDTDQDPRGDNPVADQCLDIVRKAGIQIADRFGASQIGKLCELFWFLKAAFERAPSLTPAGVRAAVDVLGTSFTSPLTFATRFSAKKWDGVDAIRPSAFYPACTCFKYTGPWHHVS